VSPLSLNRQVSEAANDTKAACQQVVESGEHQKQQLEVLVADRIGALERRVRTRFEVLCGVSLFATDESTRDV